MSDGFDLADFYRRNYEENWEKVVNCNYLIGKYDYLVELGKGGSELAAMVAELKAVLDGTWVRPT